jgi:hypothetical protein
MTKSLWDLIAASRLCVEFETRLCKLLSVGYLAAMSTVAEIKTAFKQLPERKRWQLAEWIQESVEEQQPELEAALRHSLRSPLKKYKPGHFAALASRNRRRATAA